MSEEIEIWSSEYELRQFIDRATRWGIEGVFKSRTKENPYFLFDYYVKNSRSEYDKFCSQLNKKLEATQNWKSIEIDIRDRFLPMIEQYLNWYEQNKLELKKFQPYCPYEIMFSVIESTKKEILKYFPETKPTLNNEIKAPVIRLFCAIIHQSGIIKRGSEESAESYCKTVCDTFNLIYTENIRKYFHHEAEIKEKDKQLKKVIELILPKLPSKAQQRITTWLNNKTKMYN